MDDAFYNQFDAERLSARQIDEAIGLARGLLADGKLTQDEVEFLQKWLAANLAISDQPVMRILYDRVNAALADGILDAEETADLFSTLEQFGRRDFELGEALKSTTPPSIPHLRSSSFRAAAIASPARSPTGRGPCVKKRFRTEAAWPAA